MKNTLVSGEQYCMMQIFTEEIKIVIPDMQREYCWAHSVSDNNKRPLVEAFINDLIESSFSEDKIQMGLLYAYESPINDIQLCDGQQRITSLYLLIGILYRKMAACQLRVKINCLLISEHELNEGDKIPRLQYAIRESTLFFLRDLVYYYFLDSQLTNITEGSANIKKQPWYFNEYDLDPTIQNMLSAIDLIETLLNESEVCYESLAKHVTQNITFLYFDMLNREYGEEQFVVLNTTGKALTITENLKPKFLGGLDDINFIATKNNKTELQYYADLWEEWEHFFWINRPLEHKIADNGLNEFFRWIYIIEATDPLRTYYSEKEDYADPQQALADYPFNLVDLVIENSVTDFLDLIHSYYNCLKRTIEDSEVKKNFVFKKEKLIQIECFEFLPLYAFVHYFDIEVSDRSFTRLKKFLQSRAMDENVQKSSITTVIEAVKMVKLMKQYNEDDIAAVIDPRYVISSTIISTGELYKFSVFIAHPENRISYEDAFWEAERFQCCRGNIDCLFELMAIDISINDYSLDLVYFEKVKKVVQLSLEQHSDLMRRALLTFGDFTCEVGNTPSLHASRYSFGNSPAFYGRLAQKKNGSEKKVVLMNLLKEIMLLDLITIDLVQSRFEELIQTYEQPLECSSAWDRALITFVKDEQLWKYMNYKLFCLTYDKKTAYALKQKNVTGEASYKALEFNSDLTPF